MKLSNNSTKVKMLVIDDDVFITEILKGIAEKSGCEVKCVHDGNDVRSALVAYEPEVIFLDLVLPGVDGVEIIQVLAKVGSKAKIVLMSGLDRRTLSSVTEVARTHQLNITEAVTKPFAPGQVESILLPIIEEQQKNHHHQEARAPKARFGPRVLYEPELSLGKHQPNQTAWVRAHLTWQTDDFQTLDINKLLVESAIPKVSKGLIEFALHQAQQEPGFLRNKDNVIGIKLAIERQLLDDPSTPDFLDELVKEVGLLNHTVMFEVSESSVIDASESTFDVLSRLKIKGFKLAVCIKEQNDQVLNILNKLPIDELIIDMSGDNYKSSNIENIETEFQIGSLVSYATGADLTTAGKNVFNEQQISFARRCNLSKLSGSNIGEPTDSASVLRFLNEDSNEIKRAAMV